MRFGGDTVCAIVLAREEYKIFCRVRNFSGSIESGHFFNGHVGRKPAKSFIVVHLIFLQLFIFNIFYVYFLLE